MSYTSPIFPLNPSCSKVTPSHQPLSDLQRTGLKLTATTQGRDVVLAIDLTESVGLNAEGRLRLKQIIQDSLQSGDSVYVVPFASTVNPLQPQVDPLAVGAAIPFQGKPADIDRILQALPLNSSRKLQNTDIQQTESTIYKGLAQLNQCRLTIWLIQLTQKLPRIRTQRLHIPPLSLREDGNPNIFSRWCYSTIANS